MPAPTLPSGCPADLDPSHIQTDQGKHPGILGCPRPVRLEIRHCPFPLERDGCVGSCGCSLPVSANRPWPRVQAVRRRPSKGASHRQIGGVVKTISVKREGRRWYVIVSCDKVPAEPLPGTGRAVGLTGGLVAQARSRRAGTPGGLSGIGSTRCPGSGRVGRSGIRGSGPARTTGSRSV